MKAVRLAIIPLLGTLLTGCSGMTHVLNPFYETPSEVAYFGEKNDAALNDSSGGGKGDKARAALEQMGTYQRALPAQPQNPVMQPAVVRLMWVPDHLNSHGDLVPAHYYYLKVKKESWALQDAFELEAQLNSTTGGNASAVGFVNPEDLR
jgi:hypothetical protein